MNARDPRLERQDGDDGDGTFDGIFEGIFHDNVDDDVDDNIDEEVCLSLELLFMLSLNLLTTTTDRDA